MGDMQALEILLLACVAGFLSYRLYNVLGEDNGERSENEQKNDSNIIVLNARKNSAAVDPALEKILQLDASFNMAAFLQGCEKAFEYIIRAFVANDKETLKKLLAPQLFASFSAAIDSREEAKESLAQSVEAIHSVKVQDVEIQNTTIYIKVLFKSDQIIALCDRDGKILQGSTLQPCQQQDLWTFVRDINSTSLVWHLCATKSIQDARDQHPIT